MQVVSLLMITQKKGNYKSVHILLEDELLVGTIVYE